MNTDRQKLEQFLNDADSDALLKALHEDWLNDIIPGLARLHGCSQGSMRHLEGDVAHHTAMVLSQFREVCAKRCSREPTFTELLAVLIHDIRKPDTAVALSDGSVSFPGHEQLAQGDVDRVGRRIELTGEETAELRFLVTRHGDAFKWKELTREQRAELQDSPWIVSLALLQEADARSCLMPDGAHLPVLFEHIITLPGKHGSGA